MIFLKPWYGCAAALIAVAFPAFGDIQVPDDTQAPVALSHPARRIVSLAPHVTELLFAAGAGERVVGVTAYSDYPAAAKKLPRVGGGFGIDIEAVVALKPDLIVAWRSGNPAAQVDRLRRMGFAVYVTEPRHLEDIARALRDLGRLAGTDEVADRASADFTARTHQLFARYAGRPRVSVFYQILDPTLMTVNGRHVISDIIRRCGGHNVFAHARVLAPVVEVEAVLAFDPALIAAGGTAAAWQDWEPRWRAYPALAAVKNNNLVFIPSDLLHRHSPRILAGAARLCAAIEHARAK